MVRGVESFHPVAEDVLAIPRSLVARIWFLLSNREVPVEDFDGHLLLLLSQGLLYKLLITGRKDLA